MYFRYRVSLYSVVDPFTVYLDDMDRKNCVFVGISISRGADNSHILNDNAVNKLLSSGNTFLQFIYFRLNLITSYNQSVWISKAAIL